MSTSQLAAIFVGGLAGYWAVSALIDRVRKGSGAAPDAAAKADSAGNTAESAVTPEKPKPVRSVWEEMNGGGS